MALHDTVSSVPARSWVCKSEIAANTVVGIVPPFHGNFNCFVSVVIRRR
jgi:hypothetical protein